MRKLVWTISSLWLCGLLMAAGADSYALADGTTVSGDIVSFTENGIIFRTAGDKYTDRLPWIKFSQAGLNQLAQNPKLQPFVAPFLEPALSEHPPKPEVKVLDVPRLDRKSPASLIVGLFTSPVGLMALLLIYAANIYAGYEIALFRARPVAVVTGVAAALPVVGPIIFLSLPGLREEAAPSVEETPAEAAAAESQPHRFVVPGVQPQEEIKIVAGSWQEGAPPPPSSQPEAEIFQRGQFMFNRRFFETKFSGFFGIVRREADMNKVMVVKTPKALLVVERISRIAANDMHVEVLRGESRQEVMVPFAEIQEIQLKHKNA